MLPDDADKWLLQLHGVQLSATSEVERINLGVIRGPLVCVRRRKESLSALVKGGVITIRLLPKNSWLGREPRGTL